MSSAPTASNTTDNSQQRNGPDAKIDMFKGSMRLAVDKWGRNEVTEPADIAVRLDNNLSLVEYELVNVEE